MTLTTLNSSAAIGALGRGDGAAQSFTATLSHNGNLALRYAAAGFYIFPCSEKRKPREEGDRLPFGKAEKIPVMVSSWSKEATKDEHQIREWWTRNPEALVGIPCKQNRLLVIDCDRHTAAQNGIAAFAELCEGQDEPMPAHPAAFALDVSSH
jgi:Bifunctional DNA primase/polymerase, N-terminal